MKKAIQILTFALIFAANTINAQTMIQKNNIRLQSDRMMPEALWAMGRIGGYAASPDGKRIVYNVAYYSVKENKSHHILYVMDADGQNQKKLTTSAKNETDAAWISNDRIAFLTGGEIWTMKADGTDRKQWSETDGKVEGFKFSPDCSKVIILKSIPFHDIIQKKPDDLPKTTGRVVNDLMYRHWDHYVESIQHPFVADVQNVNGKLSIVNFKDILEGEPYECPMEPFGGIEQLAWSPDSKQIAYTCRKKTGLAYSISTDSDIYLYDLESGQTQNLCKTLDYVAPEVDPTHTMKDQAINKKGNGMRTEQEIAEDGGFYVDQMVGYDMNPKFSPDGKYVAWLSMERDGYEADRQRLCIHFLGQGTKQFVTESFDSNVDDFCWAADNNTLYYIGVWHGKTNLYSTDLKGKVKQLTDFQADFGSLRMMAGGNILAERHDHFHPADLYVITPNVKKPEKTTIKQITRENEHILSQLAVGTSEARWTKTTTGEDLHYWVIKPPHFDPTKKYPTLLFCEGGPQSPVSQFWSYRWNFYIMASQGYVVIAPNRHGLPGFGQEWLEEISGDWTGQCMKDYLAAIDDAAENLPYVDKDRMGAVGASFGGFSVYYLAGHHDKRFKCFIAHDGAFNLEAMYTETEENWFSNWEYEDAFWNKNLTANAKKTYDNSPHRFVDKWDTPILCIHGELDYRINATQGMSAFNTARMKGIEAQLLIFPDENHWVLKPQNGILWQRTFFNWLDRWLK
ncbi:MAG: S9 family peptidase [Prevotella sp.]|nr:S9 family peptidase [Prevotella sp.]